VIDTEGRSLWRLIAERAAASPDKVMAIDVAGRALTYAELQDRCERVAAALAEEFGVGVGTRVSWMLPTRFEAMVLAGALSRLGAVQNPILPIYRHRETRFILDQTKAELFVVPGTFRGFDYPAMAHEVVADLPTRVLVADPDLPGVAPDGLPPEPEGDPAVTPRWIFYSSGTTADPKGAIHTDASLAAANAGMQWSLRCGPDDHASVVFPITHVGGIVFLFNTLQTGVRLLLVETFDPEGTPRWLGENGVTHAGSGTVFFLAYLAAQRAQPDRRVMPDVKVFNGGGAPKPPQLHFEMRAEMGAPLLSGWGMTESPINTMTPFDASDDLLAYTEGRATPGTEIRVVALDGTVTGAGAEGELQVRGPQQCLGYVDASLDADAFVDADDGGRRWLRTGDLGVLDPNGYLRITGRLKDIIIRKGENISAKEVEDLLYTLDGVADAAVIGLPDPASGERACAVVAPVPGAVIDFEQMVAHLRKAGLATHKIPEQLELVDALPRNPSGKVLKRELQARYGE
jgi:acyl-CoA synthetase (AMP-forming)/AMP-acid ligase II